MTGNRVGMKMLTDFFFHALYAPKKAVCDMSDSE